MENGCRFTSRLHKRRRIVLPGFLDVQVLAADYSSAERIASTSTSVVRFGSAQWIPVLIWPTSRLSEDRISSGWHTREEQAVNQDPVVEHFLSGVRGLRARGSGAG